MNKNYYYYGKKNGKRVCLAGVPNEDRSLHIGIAECSKKDNFNKKLGRKIAEGRALKKPIAHIGLDWESTGIISSTGKYFNEVCDKFCKEGKLEERIKIIT